MHRPPLRKARSLGLRRLPNGHQILSPELEEWLFSTMHVMSEGEPGQQQYFGSTMWSISLDRLAKLWRGNFDQAAREQLLSAIEGSVRFRIRLMRHSLAEALQRIDGIPVARIQTNSVFRLAVATLDIDVDIDVVLVEVDQVSEG